MALFGLQVREVGLASMGDSDLIAHMWDRVGDVAGENPELSDDLYFVMTEVIERFAPEAEWAEAELAFWEGEEPEERLEAARERRERRRRAREALAALGTEHAEVSRWRQQPPTLRSGSTASSSGSTGSKASSG